MNSIPYDEMIAGMYRKDPEYALEMINAVLEDGDANEFAGIVRQLTQAFGQSELLSQNQQLSAQLFERLKGVPNRFPSPAAALEALGFVQPSAASRSAETRRAATA